MKNFILLVFGLLLIGITSLSLQASDGKTDTSFSAGNSFNNDVYAVITQPDGKILVAGDFFDFNGTGTIRSGIARLNANGILDSSFTGSGASQVRSMALQPDGKIVIGGYFTTVNGVSRNRLARLNSDGSLDMTFNPGSGVETFDNPLVKTIAVQPDGKILIGGNFETVNGIQRRNIARLNSDGSIDTSFSAGTVTGDFTAQINVITLQPDNRILVGGYFTSIGGALAGGIARLNSNGTADSTFNVGAGTNPSVWAIKIQSDGKILIGGNFSTFNGVVRSKMARINPDGSLDATYISAVINDSTSTIYDLAILPNGKKVIVGNFDTVGGEPCNRICRLNTDGDVDRSFRSGTDSPIDYVFAVTVQADNKVIVGGTFSSVRGLPRNKIARLIYDETADFDGDGKSDISVFRASNGIWYLQQSLNGFTGLQFGASGDKLVPADYDGDGKTDVAVFRNNTWFIQRSTAGFTNIQFGQSGDIAVPGDYDADGKSDIAVYRPSTGTWFLQRSQAGFTAVQFGSLEDKPVAADFDADGKADFAVFRPSTGIWYVQQSTAGFTSIQFGSGEDKLVVADYDGDGKADYAVFRPSTGFWYLMRSQSGFTGVQFGQPGDVAVPADYDGDGKTDIGVYRNDTWLIQRSTSGFTGIQFGGIGDQPAPSSFVR